MPHVVRDDELRCIVADGPREVTVHIAVEPDGGPHHREVIHHVAADRRMFGGPKGAQLSRLAPRRDHPNRAPAHAAGTKLQESIEAVVQLAPGFPRDEFVDARRGPRWEPGIEPSREILHGTRQQLAGGAGGTQLFQRGHGIKSTRIGRNVQNG